MAATTFNAGERLLHAALETGQARPSRPRSGQGMPAAQQASLGQASLGQASLGQASLGQANLGPLDPNILSESIAAFFIGRNADGLWVARERRGRIGGIFLLKSSAVSFAHRHAGDAACATIFPEGRFELDIENNGNRLVDLMRPVVRGVARLWWQISKRITASEAV
jgi:hypothetical protein